MSEEWRKNINWKVHTDDRRVYIIRDHNWAFASWEIAKLEKLINGQSIVVHVDAHLDDVPDGVLVKNLLEAQTKEEILNVCQGQDYSSGQISESFLMRIDNFIWASLARKTIEEVIYVSNYRDEVFSFEDLFEDNKDQMNRLIISSLPSGFSYKHERFREIEDFLESAILDLDIDFFNTVDDLFDPILLPSDKVREYTKRLVELYPWNLITIAISPIYCGGYEEAKVLLENVLEAMDIDITHLSNW
ncbi:MULTISPECIES: UPF0489 family protein [Paenibacillus]|uniref:UPF0489 family protein n=1 Tax=Paenibacillus TaxID=44249 RepID=UPI001C92C418|nr:UPF0489 family protein [Paenibacillus sp. IHBB 10380]